MIFSWPFPKGPAKKHRLYFLSFNLIFEEFILFSFQCFHQYNTYINALNLVFEHFNFALNMYIVHALTLEHA